MEDSEPVAVKDKKGKLWVSLGFVLSMLGGSGGGMMMYAFSAKSADAGASTINPQMGNLIPQVAATIARVDLIEKRFDIRDEQSNHRNDKINAELNEIGKQMAKMNTILERIEKRE